MGMMTKQELGDMIGAYKEQIGFLKAELEESRKREEKLNEQIVRLQDGILAVRAPEAYRDMRSDSREVSISAEQQANMARHHEINKIRERYVRQMEGDVIQTKEDLDEMMNSVLMKGNKVGSKSLHGNAES